MDQPLYLLVRSLVAALGALPMRSSYRLCEEAAGLVYHLDQQHRHVGLTNLRIAFPEASDEWRREVLKESFRQIGRLVVEVSRLARNQPEDIFRRVAYEEGLGLEHYHAARQTGLGVLFLTAHISAWELLPAAHALLGHPLKFVVRPLDNARIDAWATRLRSCYGNQVISKFGSFRTLLRSLRGGEDVGLLIDQNVQPGDGVFAPLFGRPACTTASAALLALKSGAQVVMGFIVPAQKRGHFCIRFYPPLTARQTGDRESDVIFNTMLYNRQIEQVIREFPHCWLWGHRRFRTQPDGQNPYD